ncbi:MAG TPA: peptidylprolyl isomerase, partial [Roseiflexaceae bacterium]|nr:peptidylprolyl isomerase [Roseiflexaceae bacterium]
YWTEQRYELARRIGQSLNSLALLGSLGPQFSQQIAGQIPPLNQQVADIPTSAVEDATVNDWIDRQLIVQGAGTLSLQASDGEIAQALLNGLGSSFGPPPPPPTTTATLEPTSAITSTAETTATTSADATAAPTETPGGPTATAAPTETSAPTDTPAPTVPPTATPLPDAALQQQDGVVGRLFDAYNNEMINTGSKPNLTLDDFKAALHDQYLRSVLTDKIGAQLLPEAQFTPTTDPSSLETSHILIAVTAPISATEAERQAAFAERRPAAEAILEQLNGGADFAAVAEQSSDDAATKNSGGTLPSFDKEGKTQEGSAVDPAIVQAALALEEGEISDLIQTPFGWHIIKLNKRTVDTFEQQLQAARTEKFNEWLEQQRAAATIEHYPPQTPLPTPEPTAEGSAVPLPTVSLYSTPTVAPTEAITGTGTLTNTAPLSTTPLATSTATVIAPTSGNTAPTTSNVSPTAVQPETTVTVTP